MKLLEFLDNVKIENADFDFENDVIFIRTYSECPLSIYGDNETEKYQYLRSFVDNWFYDGMIEYVKDFNFDSFDIKRMTGACADIRKVLPLYEQFGINARDMEEMLNTMSNENFHTERLYLESRIACNKKMMKIMESFTEIHNTLGYLDSNLWQFRDFLQGRLSENGI